MVYAWQINNISNNLSNIIALAVFFSCLFIAIITLILVTIHKKILQTVAKSIDLADDLKKSPLRHKISRLAIISEETNSLENELMIWRTKYEILFEKELLKVYKNFVELLSNKKNLRPSLHNLNQFKDIYKKLSLINQNVHSIFIEILSALEIEQIQRDSLTFQKNLFKALKDEATMLTFKDMDIDHQKLKSTIASIEDLFQEFYLKLEDGHFKESWEFLLKIDQALMFLIELFDSIPYITSKITTIIPQLILELKNKHVTFGREGAKLTRNAQKYAELEIAVDNLRIKIKNELSKLQYKKANRTLNEIFDLIDEFKNQVEHEDKLKQFFEEKVDDIRRNFEAISSSVRSIEKTFKNVESVSKYPSKEKNEFEQARVNYQRTKEKADIIFSKIDVNSSIGKEIALSQLKDQLLAVMEQSLKDIIALEKSAKAVEKQNINIESLINNVIFVQTILTQCNVKVHQYKSIPELERFLEPINMLLNKLSNFSKDELSKITTQEDQNFASEKINEYLDQAWIISRDLTDAIFLDFISQEIIVYLERYVGKINGIEQLIMQCEKLFNERKLDQLIGFSLKTLGEIKRNVR